MTYFCVKLDPLIALRDDICDFLFSKITFSQCILCYDVKQIDLWYKILCIFIITVFTRVSAAMLFKLFTPQVRRLLEGGVYLKVGCDKEINYGIIFRNKQTELLSFGSDFIKAAALK